MDVNYLEYTGQTDLPYVGYVNGRAIVFTHVPGVNDFGDAIKTQVARVGNPFEYRYLLENDPYLRPYLPTAPAEKILNQKELDEARDAEEREKQKRKLAALVKVNTAQKAHIRLLEEVEELLRLAGQKKMAAEETAKTLKEAKDFLASLEPVEEQPEEKAEKPAPKPKRKKK